jgi:8-oxo-dGTP pyrophosphatase MutT (NUDIX family)
MTAQPTVVAFSLSAIQHEERYVLVHEKNVRGWWLPGGGVDAGQTLAEAAVRESAEEAGCETVLTGVLRLEYNRVAGRLRVIWHARPVDPAAPLKSVPDAESRGARWVDVEQVQAVAQGTGVDASGARLEHCWLRGEEPLWWFTYLASEGRVAPASLVHCTRDAPPRPWAGPGAPPRAEYATTTSVQVLILAPSGAVLLRGGALPVAIAVDPGEPLYEVACRVAAAALNASPRAAAAGHGARVSIGGVLRFAHDLRVADADERQHRASVTVTFVAEAVPDPEGGPSAELPPAEGFMEWSLPEALEGRAPHAAEWARAVHAAGGAAAAMCVAPLRCLTENEHEPPVQDQVAAAASSGRAGAPRPLWGNKAAPLPRRVPGWKEWKDRKK